MTRGKSRAGKPLYATVLAGVFIVAIFTGWGCHHTRLSSGVALSANQEPLRLVAPGETFFSGQKQHNSELKSNGYPHGNCVLVKSISGKLFALNSLGWDESVLWSSPDGLSWQACTNGLQSPDEGRVRIFDLVSATNGILFLGTSRGPFFSQDAGGTWKPFHKKTYDPKDTNGPIRFCMRLALDSLRGEVYARVAHDSYGIYLHEGMSPVNAWQAIGRGLPRHASVSDLAFSVREDCVYVICSHAGFFTIKPIRVPVGIFKAQRSDRRFTWRQTPPLPGDDHPLCLGVELETGDLYVGAGRGLYKRDADRWQTVVTGTTVYALSFEEGGAGQAAALTPDSILLRDHGVWHSLPRGPWNEHARFQYVCFFRGDLYLGTNEGLFAWRRELGQWSRKGISPEWPLDKP